MVTGTGPLGCAPAELATRSRNGECASELQQAVLIFNSELAQLIQQLNIELRAEVFVSANAFQNIYPTRIAYSYVYRKVYISLMNYRQFFK
jgi:hypothetical protein